MTDDISAISSPDFPVLLIENDGSVGALEDIVYWTSDVDMWFWSSAEAYIVDSLGYRLISWQSGMVRVDLCRSLSGYSLGG